MGIRDKPIAPGSPWQNGFAERVIGSVRPECTDHVVAFDEKHLRRVLQSHVRYYRTLPRREPCNNAYQPLAKRSTIRLCAAREDKSHP
jgi:transposase InsO family protein